MLQFIKGNRLFPASVIQIRVDGVRNYEELLIVRIRVILYHIRIGIAAEIAGMRFPTMYHQYRAADLIAVFQDWLVHKGHTSDYIPASIGVQ